MDTMLQLIFATLLCGFGAKIGTGLLKGSAKNIANAPLGFIILILSIILWIFCIVNIFNGNVSDPNWQP